MFYPIEKTNFKRDKGTILKISLLYKGKTWDSKKSEKTLE